MTVTTPGGATGEAPHMHRRWSFLGLSWPQSGVRTGTDLTLGERAADKMRNGLGSWTFVFAALIFLAAWMMFNRNVGFDKYPFILLNLVLSCLAAMQGAILLIAARRSDQIASELAQHDFDTDQAAARRIEEVHGRLADMEQMNVATSQSNHELLLALRSQLDSVAAQVAGLAPPPN